MKTFNRFERFQAAPDYVDARVLSTTAENFDIPDGAKWVIINSNAPTTGPVYVTYLTSAEEELVTNGAFTTDTGWTKGTGWTIAGGVAVCSGAQVADSDISQSNAALVAGKPYKTVFTTAGRSAGNVCVVVGGTEGTDRAGNTTYTETVVCGSTNTLVALRADLDWNGNANDFSVTPIAVVPATDNTSGTASEIFCIGQEPIIRGIDGYTQISMVAASGTPVVTLAYYA